MGAASLLSKSSDSDAEILTLKEEKSADVPPINSAIQDNESSSSEYESENEGDGSGYEMCPEDKNRSKYLPLLKEVIRGDWEKTQAFLDLHPDALTAGIAANSVTPLHVAVGRGAAIAYVKKQMDMMSPEQLESTDDKKNTALNEAAMVGNVAAAQLLVERNARLLLIRDSDKNVPLSWAAYFGQKEMVSYLLEVTPHDVQPSPYEVKVGLHILNHIIFAEFYDIGLDLVQRFPNLARWAPSLEKTPLLLLPELPSALRSGTQFNT